jgi:hypothetical protein
MKQSGERIERHGSWRYLHGEVVSRKSSLVANLARDWGRLLWPISPEIGVVLSAPAIVTVHGHLTERAHESQNIQQGTAESRRKEDRHGTVFTSPFGVPCWIFCGSVPVRSPFPVNACLQSGDRGHVADAAFPGRTMPHSVAQGGGNRNIAGHCTRCDDRDAPPEHDSSAARRAHGTDQPGRGVLPAEFPQVPVYNRLDGCIS